MVESIIYADAAEEGVAWVQVRMQVQEVADKSFVLQQGRCLSVYHYIGQTPPQLNAVGLEATL